MPMASWATRRKLLYIALLCAAVLFALAVPVFLITYNRPSCFDGKQNQNEKGIDCGGLCTRLCRVEAFAPSVLWARVLKVSEGVYNAVAYIENPNLDLGAIDAPYLFRIYDLNNLLIYERKGKTSIPSGGAFPVFEGTITTRERMAVRATFQFLEELDWQPYPAAPLGIRVTDIKFEKGDETSPPRLSAVISNRSNRPIPQFGVVALLTGVSGNVVAVSRTVVDSLALESKTPVTFTWRLPFSEEVPQIQVIPQLFPTIHY